MDLMDSMDGMDVTGGVDAVDKAEEHRVPGALIAVGWLFILGGSWGLFEMGVLFQRGELEGIDLGFAGIFVGIGLLMLRRGWRTLALVYLCGVMILVPIMTVWFLLSAPERLDAMLFGAKVPYAPRTLGMASAVVGFAMSVWAYRVLRRADVRRLFYRAETDFDRWRSIGARIEEIRVFAAGRVEELTGIEAELREERPGDEEARSWVGPVIEFCRRLEMMAASDETTAVEARMLAREAVQFLRQRRVKGVGVADMAARLAEVIRERDASEERGQG